MKRLVMLTGTLFAAAAVAVAAEGEGGAKALYAAKCASCHGKAGQGSAQMAKVFKVDAGALKLDTPEAAKKSDEDWAKIIKEGKGKMPAYKTLTDAQVKELVAHMRTFQPATKSDAGEPARQEGDKTSSGVVVK